MTSGRSEASVFQRAYVLHRRPYRETSAIVELFSENDGRVAVVARGLQKKRSNLSALCQPLQALSVSWRGRSDLKSLVSIERDGSPVMYRDDRLYSLLYSNELLMRLLLHHDPHPGLFQSYEQLLAAMASTVATDVCLRRFERILLQELGFALELDRVADTGLPIDPDGHYRYVYELGLVAAAEHDDGPCYTGSVLLEIAGDRYDTEPARRAAKQLMRECLRPLLGERPLASRELFRRRPG